MTREEKMAILKDIIDGEIINPQVRKDVGEWAIKELEQEPKTGRWIMTSDYLTTAYGSIDYVKCSCCGEYSLEEGDYCPNCGAKMIEPQEVDHE